MNRSEEAERRRVFEKAPVQRNVVVSETTVSGGDGEHGASPRLGGGGVFHRPDSSGQTAMSSSSDTRRGEPKDPLREDVSEKIKSQKWESESAENFVAKTPPQNEPLREDDVTPKGTGIEFSNVGGDHVVQQERGDGVQKSEDGVHDVRTQTGAHPSNRRATSAPITSAASLSRARSKLFPLMLGAANAPAALGVHVPAASAVEAHGLKQVQ